MAKHRQHNFRAAATSSSIDPNQLKSRDQLMVAVINGATKAYVEKDRRREASKKACRGRFRFED